MYSFEQKLIFHAVLEGLYTDGISGEALDAILPDQEDMWVQGEPEKTNFVYSCPICMPAFDACRLYGARKPFFGQKTTQYNTFGAGPSDALETRLKGSPDERRKAIRELIEIWVDRRLKMMRLTEEEHNKIEANLEQMKRDGEKALKNFNENKNGDFFSQQYEEWKSCPFCDGAAAAAKM